MRCLLLAAGAAGVACSGDGAGPVPACRAAGATPVSLAVGQYTAVDPAPDSGCVVFPSNAGGLEAEFVVVPQSATGTPGKTVTFALRGAAEPVAAPPAVGAQLGAWLDLSAAERFHAFLRLGEERRAWPGLAPISTPPSPGAAPPVFPARPVVGELRKFSVFSKLNANPPQFTDVWAEARVVGQHIAIFVDTAAPQPELDSLGLDELRAVFDTRLYPIDTAAFGRESDVNQDSVVIVLMTNVVNKLVTAQECQDKGFVAGFFLGADIDPAFRNDSRVNHAEIFYSIVADEAATLSCAHTRDQVKALVPVTFVHEFQHMISYNQHVLVRGGSGELLWLNEGLSHYAEELGGRSYLTDPASSVATCTIGTSPCRFLVGNLFNAYEYLRDPGAHFLVPGEGIGSLAERGSAWLFVRYLVDHFAGGATQGDWDTFTRRLVQTDKTGEANVAAATGQPLVTPVTRWALANLLDDLDTVPGFAAPAELQYVSWNLRAVFRHLNAQRPATFQRAFPLVPTVSPAAAVDLSGTLRAGSGVYHRALQPAGGAGFLLTFRHSNGGLLPADLMPRLNVVRIR